MKKYIKIIRIDHWIKQFFIVPGVICALLLTDSEITINTLVKFIIGFIGTSLIASANYAINEYLDAEFDKFHPTKKNRSAVVETLNGKIVWTIWLVFSVVGILIGINKPFRIVQLWLLVMGILYNVKPIRTKDVMILDVLSESINNMIRLLLGWFIISDSTLPPCSILFGYWMSGAFLMAIKRYAEYIMIDDKELASKYRKSFKYYTEHSLLISAFFYAMCAVFFIGIFLVKYRMELIFFMPFLIGLFCYYFYISFKKDSAVQKPEKLYHEHGLMIYLAVLIVIFILLMTVDIPFIQIFTENNLIYI
jgi:4-hydroxybenzoate polyprenyltransferase